MSAFWNSFTEGLNAIKNTFGLADILDIAIVSFLIYQLIKLMRRSRTQQLLRGIVIVLIAYFVSWQFELKTLNTVMQSVVQFGIIALVVVFQPELRRALETMGRAKLGGISLFSGHMSTEAETRWRDALVTISDSAEHMSKTRTGALIVIERRSFLTEIIETGTTLDSTVSCELLETVFYEGSPLHDGAVIIRDAKVAAAGCLLPVSQNPDISRDMGTRHRAAIGISENSDAVVVVVSEETGLISIAQGGVILRRLDRTNLLRILQNEIIPRQDGDSEGRKSIFGRIFKK